MPRLLGALSAVPPERAARDFKILRRHADPSDCDAQRWSGSGSSGAAACSYTCSSRFNTTLQLRQDATFEHIPKCAGSAVETFLGLEFSGHDAMRSKLPGPSGRRHFVVA